MKKVLYIVIATFIIAGTVSADSAPVVSNVQVAQVGGNTKEVIVRYRLEDVDNDLCSVWAIVSNDGGYTWTIQPKTIFGDYGVNIVPNGDKIFTWFAGDDIPGLASDFFMVRIYADDGNGMANMVLIPQCPGQYNLGNFWIGKYEVTNLEYCEFLNNAHADGCWNTNQEITRCGTDGKYIYSVNDGRQHYPIRYVSFGDAFSYCNWRSNREGRRWRLPSYAEWCKAAYWDPVLPRTFSYGYHSDTIDTTYCNYCNSSKGGPTPVGYYNGINPGTKNAASFYGCYDMSGNVFEWTNTQYDSANFYIMGGYYSSPENEMPHSTTWIPLGVRGEYCGFRVVLDLN